MREFTTIELQRDARGFATLWLDRADKHNAFNAQMIDELTAVIGTLNMQPNLRFLLLRGRGRHFSAGADLAWMQASVTLGYEGNQHDAQRLGELMYGLNRLPMPTLAVVQGAAFGGAVGLVSCCDMAIGADDAMFCLSEVRIGLLPAVISPFVVQALGQRAARRYALSAERFNGNTACHLGLLAQSCPPGELDDLLETWITNLLLNGPQAMRACKALLHAVGDGALSPSVRQQTEDAIARTRISAEGQEGLNAFLEKRPPAWQESNP